MTCQHTLFEPNNSGLVVTYLKCSKCGECFFVTTRESVVYGYPIKTTVQQVLDSVKSPSWVVTNI